jgi:hypothetical protein
LFVVSSSPSTDNKKIGRTPTNRNNHQKPNPTLLAIASLAAIILSLLPQITTRAQEPIADGVVASSSPPRSEPGGLTDMERANLITSAVNRLSEIQEEDGAWSYEGVYRVRVDGTDEPQIPSAVVGVITHGMSSRDPA